MADNSVNINNLANPNHPVIGMDFSPFQNTSNIIDKPVENNASINQVGQKVIDAVSDDVAVVELNLIAQKIFDNIKDFLKDSETSESDVKGKIEESVKSISEKANGLPSGKIDVSDIKPDESIANTEKPKIEIDADFIKKIASSILSSFGIEKIISTTIEKTISSIKSLIDGNAEEFKKTLNDEMNSKLELSKFSKLTNEKGENVLDEKIEKPEEVEEKIDEESVDLEREIVPDEIDDNDNETISQEEQKEILEEQRHPNNELNLQVDTKEDKQATNKFIENKNKLDRKQKQTLLEVDKDLAKINTSLKKVIELQEDVVEEYDPRNEDAEAVNKKAKKEKNKDDEQQSIDFDISNLDDSGKKSNKKFASALLLGSIAVLLILFRGYARSEQLHRYMQEHENDDFDTVKQSFDEEVAHGNAILGEFGDEEDDVEEAVDAALDDIGNVPPPPPQPQPPPPPPPQQNEQPSELDTNNQPQVEEPNIEEEQPEDQSSLLATETKNAIDRRKATSSVEQTSQEIIQAFDDASKVIETTGNDAQGLSNALAKEREAAKVIAESASATMSETTSELEKTEEGLAKIEDKLSEDLSGINEGLEGIQENIDHSELVLKSSNVELPELVEKPQELIETTEVVETSEEEYVGDEQIASIDAATNSNETNGFDELLEHSDNANKQKSSQLAQLASQSFNDTHFAEAYYSQENSQRNLDREIKQFEIEVVPQTSNEQLVTLEKDKLNAFYLQVHALRSQMALALAQKAREKNDIQLLTQIERKEYFG